MSKTSRFFSYPYNPAQVCSEQRIKDKKNKNHYSRVIGADTVCAYPVSIVPADSDALCVIEWGINFQNNQTQSMGEEIFRAIGKWRRLRGHTR